MTNNSDFANGKALAFGMVDLIGAPASAFGSLATMLGYLAGERTRVRHGFRDRAEYRRAFAEYRRAKLA